MNQASRDPIPNQYSKSDCCIQLPYKYKNKNYYYIVFWLRGRTLHDDKARKSNLEEQKMKQNKTNSRSKDIQGV